MALNLPRLIRRALLVFVAVFAAIQASFDPREVWDRIEWSEATR